MVHLSIFITTLHLKYLQFYGLRLKYDPISNNYFLSLGFIYVSRPNIIYIKKMLILKFYYYYYYLLLQFLLKLKLADNTTILLGKSQLVCLMAGIYLYLAFLSIWLQYWVSLQHLHCIFHFKSYIQYLSTSLSQLQYQ